MATPLQGSVIQVNTNIFVTIILCWLMLTGADAPDQWSVITADRVIDQMFRIFSYAFSNRPFVCDFWCESFVNWSDMADATNRWREFIFRRFFWLVRMIYFHRRRQRESDWLIDHHLYHIQGWTLLFSRDLSSIFGANPSLWRALSLLRQDLQKLICIAEIGDKICKKE